MSSNRKLSQRTRLKSSPVMTIVTAASGILAVSAVVIFSFNFFNSRSVFASRPNETSVTLVNFQAATKGDGVQLQWATNGENNVKSYRIEKSVDGENFVPIASSQPGNGSDRATRFYVIADLNPQSGMNYYNLMMEGSDGQVQKLASTEYVRYNAPNPDFQAYKLAKVVNFVAEQNKDKVDISWATTSESGAKKFEVLKSTDGQNFVRLGVMNASDISNTSKIYTYSDTQPSKAINYYKLMVYDADGNAFYCSAVASLVK